MRIYHIAAAADWARAQKSGSYTISTRGRSLREEGFIHAAHADQWQRVRENFYADATEPLVLLTIDTDKLTAPVVEERPPGTQERFPHIYGALNADAVLRAVALPPLRAGAGGANDEGPAAPTEGRPAPTEGRPGATEKKTFSQLFIEEMIFRVALGLGVMIFAGAVGFPVQERYGNDVAFPTTLGALALGIGVAIWLSRRRDTRIRVAITRDEAPSQE